MQKISQILAAYWKNSLDLLLALSLESFTIKPKAFKRDVLSCLGPKIWNILQINPSFTSQPQHVQDINHNQSHPLQNTLIIWIYIDISLSISKICYYILLLYTVNYLTWHKYCKSKFSIVKEMSKCGWLVS